MNERLKKSSKTTVDRICASALICAISVLQMFSEYAQLVKRSQYPFTESLNSNKPVKQDVQDANSHDNGEYIPIDDQCYDGSVVSGSVVWKSCSA